MDAFDQPTIAPRELAEVSRLADGTLAPEHRAEVQRRVDESDQLRQLYERERGAVAAVRDAAASVRAPHALRSRIEALDSGRRRRYRRPTAAAGAVAAALAAVLVALLLLPTGTPVAPSVSEAAALAFRGSIQSAPAPDPKAPEAWLDLSVQRLQFPNWSIGLGWAAVGQRADTLVGRRVRTVYYEGHGSAVAYTIVSGPALARPAGMVTTVHGQELRTLSLDGRLVVTWRRRGHTCLLSGTGVTAAQLSGLAVWRYGSSR